MQRHNLEYVWRFWLKGSPPVLRLALFLFAAVPPVWAQDLPETGVLVHRVSIGKDKFGEPGQLVRYRTLQDARVDIEIDGEVFRSAGGYYVVPWDPDFVPSWAYIRLQRLAAGWGYGCLGGTPESGYLLISPIY